MSADYYRGYNKDDWYQSALTVEGKISNWDLTYTGGYFSRQVDNLVDYSQYSIAYDAPGDRQFIRLHPLRRRLRAPARPSRAVHAERRRVRESES